MNFTFEQVSQTTTNIFKHDTQIHQLLGGVGLVHRGRVLLLMKHRMNENQIRNYIQCPEMLRNIPIYTITILFIKAITQARISM